MTLGGTLYKDVTVRAFLSFELACGGIPRVTAVSRGVEYFIKTTVTSLVPFPAQIETLAKMPQLLRSVRTSYIFNVTSNITY
jgi:hypothetical protein